jgi:hypothetical protein
MQIKYTLPVSLDYIERDGQYEPLHLKQRMVFQLINSAKNAEWSFVTEMNNKGTSWKL